jgi:hypothetical protein
MSLEEFQQHQSALEDDWRLIDVDAHTRPNGEVQFAAVWEPNPDGDDWQVHPELSAAEVDELIDSLGDQGFAPSRVAAYELDGQVRYISLWHDQSVGWLMYGGQTADEYQDLVGTTSTTIVWFMSISPPTREGISPTRSFSGRIPTSASACEPIATGISTNAISITTPPTGT